MLNVGLVGCGRVSDFHMNAYRNIPEVKVVAVSDINIDRAKVFAQKHGIKGVYGDPLKLFELKDLNFVDICTPISTHAKLVCEAAKSGNNIFLEKPMARSSKECDQMIKEISKNRVKLCICHNQLFLPTVLQAKEIIDSSNFHLAYLKVSVRESAELIGAPSWIMTPEQGGALWETGAHAAYLQLHFLKSIEKVWAIGEKIKHSVPDHFIIMLTSSNKTIGTIEISWLAKKEEELFEFIDSTGRKIEIQNYNFLLQHSERPEKNLLEGFYRDQKQIIKKWMKFFVANIRNRKLINYLPQYILLTKFIESIKNDITPPVTPEEGRKTVRLLEYIEESLNKNEPIKVCNDI
ncbi:MAG: Gfo/Idh/MocA family oxidoreductase [Candidatus Bathyarchaeota archaeon]|nr:Gfo/Idh/MocA family oxidoreductase [Candidatus Bathyarchaeota archaeon]